MYYIGIFFQTFVILIATGIICVAPGFILSASFVNNRRILRSPFCWVLGFICGYAGYTVACDYLGRYWGSNIFTTFLLPPIIIGLLGLGIFRRRGYALPADIDLSWRQMAVCIVFAFVVIAQALPIELSNGIYWGEPYDDYVKHIYIVNAVARSGCPPLNPIYAPFGDNPLFYYYGFSLWPGMLVRTLHVNSVITFFTCAFLVAVSFSAICVALANWLTGTLRGGWIALGLCFVTGLDLLAIFGMELCGRKVFPEFEWWNYGQVVAITGFLVWVPQHVMATIYSLVAMLLLGVLAKCRWNILQLIPVILLIVSCGMTSTYIAIALFGSLFLILILSFLPRFSIGGRGMTTTVLISGAILLCPFYLYLSTADRFEGTSLRLDFRPFVFDGEAARYTFFAWFDKFKPWFGGLQAYRLLTLPIQYFFEFGFWLIVMVAWFRLRKQWTDKREIMSRLEAISLCAIIIGSLFVSTRIFADLNWRILQIFQAVLICVGADFIICMKPFNFNKRPILASISFFALFAGVMGTLCNGALLRLNIAESPYSNKPVISKRAHAAGPIIESNTPLTARIQYNPSCHDNPPWPIYVNRQIPLSDSWFNTAIFGTSNSELTNVVQEVSTIFNKSIQPQERRKIIDKYKIDYLLLQKEDYLFDKPIQEILPGEHAVVCSGADWKLIDVRTKP